VRPVLACRTFPGRICFGVRPSNPERSQDDFDQQNILGRRLELFAGRAGRQAVLLQQGFGRCALDEDSVAVADRRIAVGGERHMALAGDTQHRQAQALAPRALAQRHAGQRRPGAYRQCRQAFAQVVDLRQLGLETAHARHFTGHVARRQQARPQQRRHDGPAGDDEQSGR
jgi:hypothetical protein